MDPDVRRHCATLEDQHWWYEYRRRIIAPFIERIMTKHKKNLIVDIGCGTGGTVNYLSNDYRCIGFDQSEVSIKIAREKYPQSQFICGSNFNFLKKFAPETNLYLLMDVIEHIEDEQKFLSNLIAIARPGAHILITVPADNRLWGAHDIRVDHFRRYMEDDLVALIGTLSVRLKFVAYFNKTLYWPIRLARKLGNLVGRTAGGEGTDISLPPTYINNFLLKLLHPEEKFLTEYYDGTRQTGYTKGASILAVLVCK